MENKHAASTVVASDFGQTKVAFSPKGWNYYWWRPELTNYFERPASSLARREVTTRFPPLTKPFKQIPPFCPAWVQCWSDLDCAGDAAGHLENQDNSSLQCVGIPCNHSPYPPAVQATTSKGKTEGSRSRSSIRLYWLEYDFVSKTRQPMKFEIPSSKATRGEGKAEHISA